MIPDKLPDNTFLAEFLREYDASTATEGPNDTAGHNAALPLSHQQLLSETDALLSSLDPAPDTPNQSEGRAKSTKRVPGDEKRQRRNALATVRRLRYRQKLKDEKVALEQQEIKLSRQLKELKAAKVGEKIPQSSMMTLSMWRAIAAREKEKKYEAEEQQRQLKAIVMNRAKVIKDLNELVLQRKEGNQAESTGWFCGDTDGASLFRSFKGELDLLYAKTDEVLSGLEFKMAWPMAYKPKRRQQHGVEFYDSADATVMPYSFEQMCRAVSKLMLADPEGYEAQHSENTAAIKYHLKCRLRSGDSAGIAAYNVTRRYAEANRMVFVWRALYEGQDSLSGSHTDETGWMVVRPSLTVKSKGFNETPSTILECYARFVPMGIGEASASKGEKDRFATILAKAGEEEVKGIMKMLERVLLGDEQANFPSLVVCE